MTDRLAEIESRICVRLDCADEYCHRSRWLVAEVKRLRAALDAHPNLDDIDEHDEMMRRAGVRDALREVAQWCDAHPGEDVASLGRYCAARLVELVRKSGGDK